jgi:hypothetical protein
MTIAVRISNLPLISYLILYKRFAYSVRLAQLQNKNHKINAGFMCTVSSRIDLYHVHLLNVGQMSNIHTICYSCNRPWRFMWLWDVEVLTFSRQSGHSWRDCQPYAPAARINWTENSNDLNWNRTRNLPAFSTIPQPPKLRRALHILIVVINMCWTEATHTVVPNMFWTEATHTVVPNMFWTDATHISGQDFLNWCYT